MTTHLTELEKKFTLECTCGCGELKFSRWDSDKPEDQEEVFISYWEPAWYGKQVGFYTIIDRIKVAWKILSGKAYCFYDIIIPAKRLAEFKEWVADL